MSFRLLLTAFSLTIASTLFSQSLKLSGKVTNEKNEPIPGASIKTSNGAGIATNVDGNFILSIPAGKYEITVSAIGYETKVISDVEVAGGSLNELNILLQSKSKDLGNVVISTNRSNARRESVNSLIAYQKNTNTVTQVISAETIRRSPDRNTGEVLRRVPGTSIQDGKYLVVRGLADRYNLAMLNGVMLSSTEPDRKTFSFDIFPSSVIDNIIINKAFVPELPGEWAGGLIQVNTRDIPTANFFNVLIGTGVNTNVIGNSFYKYKGSNTDFLGFDNGVRTLPNNFPTKTNFANLTGDQKLALGQQIGTNWGVSQVAADPNLQVQLSGGFVTSLFKKKLGGTLALNYNRRINNYSFNNSFFSINNNLASPDFVYNTHNYSADILGGGLANFTLQLNNNNKISVKNLFNINSTTYTALRTGQEFISGTDNIRARELAQRTNIFFNTQIAGDHNIPQLKARFDWYGSFNILDQYIPQQRRLEYIQDATTPNAPFFARVSTGQSQKSGSVFYSNLSDYIYTSGANLAKTYDLFGKRQTIKGGYMLQIKDRLFDSRPFYIQLFDNSLKTLPEDQLFNASNFVSGKLGFDEFEGKQYRYIANSILNAGYVQLDNALTDKLRAVWGVRYENFDQLIGSVRKSDPRFVHTKVEDYLPSLNLTYKATSTTNVRLSGSQTVIRPEFRELTNFAFYDFQLGASVLGNQNLGRTKVTNGDLRYEIYPRSGELVTVGVFYKYFDKPIELYFNQSGAGSSNTFNYQNADKASSYGAEFEMRKKLDASDPFKNFTLIANLSYIYNRVTSASAKLDRPMQGQSPYIINIGLQYDLEKEGINTTILFNQIGRRIAYVGNDQVPAIWENPRPLLDFQIAKKLLAGRGELKLNISDIINKTAVYYHDLNNDKKFTKSQDATAIQRNYGTTFSLSFAYNFLNK